MGTEDAMDGIRSDALIDAVDLTSPLNIQDILVYQKYDEICNLVVDKCLGTRTVFSNQKVYSCTVSEMTGDENIVLPNKWSSRVLNLEHLL